MMGQGIPGLDDLVTYLFREWDIHQIVTVDVPDLALADDVLQAAKPVRRGRHALPGFDCPADRFLRASYAHGSISILFPNFLHRPASAACSLADRTLNSSTIAAT